MPFGPSSLIVMTAWPFAVADGLAAVAMSEGLNARSTRSHVAE
jgi:hypothetical protein